MDAFIQGILILAFIFMLVGLTEGIIFGVSDIKSYFKNKKEEKLKITIEEFSSMPPYIAGSVPIVTMNIAAVIDRLQTSDFKNQEILEAAIAKINTDLAAEQEEKNNE